MKIKQFVEMYKDNQSINIEEQLEVIKYVSIASKRELAKLVLDNCTAIVDGKPQVCPHCGEEKLLEVIYGEPAGPVDENEFILGGCCICETSHNWECPQCQARFRDESLW
jgi:hypothetical protein